MRNLPIPAPLPRARAPLPMLPAIVAVFLLAGPLPAQDELENPR
jgi:hypothetical protein